MRKPLITKVETTSAQGDGSWLEFRRPTWGERRGLVAQMEPLEGETLEQFAFDVLSERLESWNWKDTDGKDMPLPKRMDDFKAYTEEEVETLFDVVARAVRGVLRYTEEDAKN